MRANDGPCPPAQFKMNLFDQSLSLLLVASCLCFQPAHSFGIHPLVFVSCHRKPRGLASRCSSQSKPQATTRPTIPSSYGSVVLYASSPRTSSLTLNQARRKELLTRRGNHFRLDRSTGQIEFGATAYLVTQLMDDKDGDASDSAELISTWLQDERGLALSIWDENLIQERGDSIFRLQVMTLQFVTLQVAPWVDVEMKTVMSKGDPSQPVFCLQSVDFDPNIQLLPGMRVTAESFGIVIEVAGQLRPSTDGKGVQGAIAFQTTGQLSAPLRLLPEAALKAAADTINDTIVRFATNSFQKGAREQYRKFLAQR